MITFEEWKARREEVAIRLKLDPLDTIEYTLRLTDPVRVEVEGAYFAGAPHEDWIHIGNGVYNPIDPQLASTLFELTMEIS